MASNGDNAETSIDMVVDQIPPQDEMTVIETSESSVNPTTNSPADMNVEQSPLQDDSAVKETSKASVDAVAEPAADLNNAQALAQPETVVNEASNVTTTDTTDGPANADNAQAPAVKMITFIVESPAPPPPRTRHPSSRIYSDQAVTNDTTVAEPSAPPPKPTHGSWDFPEHSALFEIENVDEIEPEIQDTEYPTLLYTTTNRGLYLGKNCKTTFVVDQYQSFLQITMTEKDERDGYLNHPNRISKILFPYAAFSTPGVLRSLGDKFDHRDGQECHRECFELCLPLDMEWVGTENIFVEDLSEELLEIQSWLERAWNSELDLKVHLCTYGASSRTLLPAHLLELNGWMMSQGVAGYLTDWQDPDKDRFLIQANEFIPKDRRPHIGAVTARKIFFNAAQYMTVMTVCDLEQQEVEYTETADWGEERRDVYLMKIPGGADRVFVAMFQAPHRLREGDVVKVVDPETNDLETALTAVVTGDLPGIPMKYTTAWLPMQWNKEKMQFEHGTFSINPDQILSIPTGSNSLLADQITAKTPLSVELRPQVSDKNYRNRVAGIARFFANFQNNADDTQEVLNILLALDMTGIETHNVYDQIETSVPNIDQLMAGLNQEQRQVFARAQKAPAGFVIIQGPPGTGKSYTILRIAFPFVVANQPNSHVLSLAASNGCVDTSAVAFDEKICALESWNGQYVVRIHAVETETSVARQAGLLRRPRPDDARPTLVEDIDEEASETLKQMTLASSIHAAYKEEHHQAFPLINDPRVTVKGFSLSVGYRILQLLDQHPRRAKGDPQDLEDDADRRIINQLREMYAQFAGNVTLTDTQLRRFSELLRKARAIVLKNATVICTTPALAIEAKVYSACQDLIMAVIFDEACRIEEPVTLAVLGLYSKARLRGLAGDIKQLPVMVKVNVKILSVFGKQYAYSLMARLIDTGAPFTGLLVQFRMAPDQRRVVSSFGYRDQLQDDESVKHERRPIQARLRQYNKERFNRERVSVYINVRFEGTPALDKLSSASAKNVTHTSTNEGGSRYNEAFVTIGINLAKDLMDLIPDGKIAILTGYNAQYRLYLRAKANLVRENSKYSSLTVSTFDAAQGLEFDITIKDLLMKLLAGFLAAKPRLVVAESRARYGSYTIASKLAIDESTIRSLRQLQSEILRIGTEYQMTGPFSSQYFTVDDFRMLTNEQTDLIENEDGPRVQETTSDDIGDETAATTEEATSTAVENGDESNTVSNDVVDNGWAGDAANMGLNNTAWNAFTEAPPQAKGW